MCHGLSRNLECKCSVEKRFIPSQRRFVNGIFLRTHFHSHKHGPLWGKIISELQAFLHFRGFDFRNFRFNAVYISILFSSPLVLLSNLDLRGFRCPHINSVNRGMPVLCPHCERLAMAGIVLLFYSWYLLSLSTELLQSPLCENPHSFRPRKSILETMKMLEAPSLVAFWSRLFFHTSFMHHQSSSVQSYYIY